MDDSGLVIFVIHNAVAVYKAFFMLAASVGVLAFLTTDLKELNARKYAGLFLASALVGIGVSGYLGAEDMVFEVLSTIIQNPPISL